MSVRSRVRRANQSAPELNITAFLNLMVILVPFLLITAVFSHMTILELNLPPKSKKPDTPQQLDKKKQINFEMILRKNEIAISDTINGVLQSYQPKTANQQDYDYEKIQSLLLQIKSKYPDKKNFSILLEPSVSYDLLIQAMDTVRVVVKEDEDGNAVQEELFPKISIGDAPEKLNKAS